MNKKTKRATAEKSVRKLVNDRMDEVRDKALGEDIAQTVAGSLGEHWAEWFHLLKGREGHGFGMIRVMYANQKQNADALEYVYAEAAKKLARTKEGHFVSKKFMEKVEHCFQIALNIELLDIAYKADPSITRNLEAANWLRAKHGAGDPLVDPNNSTHSMAAGGQS